MSQTLEERRLQFHVARVGEFLDPLNPHVKEFMTQSRDGLFRYTGDLAESKLGALQALEDVRQRQALSLAYFDVFWIFAVVSIVLIVFVLLMKRSVAEKGERIGAE